MSHQPTSRPTSLPTGAGRPPRSRPRPGSRYRPQLESLEARTVPSGIGLDPSFGSGGKVALPLGDGILNAAASLPDGRVVAAGSTQSGGVTAVLLTRFNADGTLDGRFGTNGVVITSVPGSGFDEANAVAVQLDGKIIVAGDSGRSPGMFLMGRYLPDGGLDPSFGGSGIVRTAFTTNDRAWAVALQTDGKILAAGEAFGDFALARYLADGSLDGTFGAGGKVTTNFGFHTGRLGTTTQDGDTARALALQPDGKILAAGVSIESDHFSLNFSADNIRYGVARYLPDGSLDPSFSGGIVAGQAAGLDDAYAALVQTDGRIVLAGEVLSGSATMAVHPSLGVGLARLNPDGSPDATFQSDTSLAHQSAATQPSAPVASRAFKGLLAQPDGTFLAGGTTADKTAFLLAEFGSDGTLRDTATASFDTFAQGNALVRNGPGRVLMVGATQHGPNSTAGRQVALARFTGGAILSGDLFVTGADAGGGPNVVVFDAATRQQLTSFFAYEASFLGGVRVALADVNGDGAPDILAAPGPGRAPEIKVYSGVDFSPLFSFPAYSPQFTGGVWVAAGDVNGDGFADVICGADRGGGPNIAVYSGKALTAGQGATQALLFSFFAYDPGFTGGVRIAAGDVNGDGSADIICGAGPGGGPNVTVFSGTDAHLLLSFFAFDPGFANGIYVAGADVSGNGKAAIVVGAGAGGGPNVTVFDDQGRMLLTFFPYDPAFTGGVRVAGVTRNGQPLILSVAGPGGGPDVRLFTVTAQTVDAFFAYDPKFTGGIYVAGSAS